MEKGKTLAEQHRRVYNSVTVSSDIDEARKNIDENGRLLVPRSWFEVDAYGAAVAGILGAIKLGLNSGSLGVGAEEEILRKLRQRLIEMDPDLRGIDVE